MFCRKCGIALLNGARICPGCGISIVSDENIISDTNTCNLTLPEEQNDLNINVGEDRSGQTEPSTNEVVRKKKNYLPVVCVLSVVLAISMLCVAGIVAYSNPKLKYGRLTFEDRLVFIGRTCRDMERDTKKVYEGKK